MDKKRIIIFTNSGISKEIYQNLKFLGFDVYAYLDNDFIFRPTVIEKLKNLWYKKIDNRYDYYFHLKLKKIKSHNDYRLQLQKDFDYGLLIRPDKYDAETLSIIRNKTKYLVGYQWDGMNRYPEIYKKITFFDKFYCFNPIDCKDKIEFATNFYFDYSTHPLNKEIFDVIYIGFFTAKRYDILLKISEHLPNKRLYLNLKTQNKQEAEQMTSSSINAIDNTFSYNEMMVKNTQSKALLDLKAEEHDGLSFRFFEAMKLSKKVITTNKDVEKYDFYNSNNIFILTDTNYHELSAFLELPFKEFDNKIIEKYSFSHWLKRVLSTQ
ncbi:hypothetical protein OBK25_01080 [Empedobacter falsenii]